jgi:predicted GH43/DUF377 family glycosyl hydrolase
MNKLAVMLLALLWLFLLVLGCGKSKTTSKPPVVPTSLEFIKNPAGGPVVSSGTAGWPIFPADPAVLKDNEGYHLFFTTLFCKSGGSYYYSWDSHNLGACNITDVVGTVGYAFSADGGLSWEFRSSPVVLPGPEAWQSGDLETAFAALLGDTLYLFYSASGLHSGQPFPNRFQVGVATVRLNGETIHQRLMTDAVTFQKQPEPLLPFNTSTTTFDNNTQEPSVVIKDSLLEVFYVGVGFSLPEQSADAPGQTITSVGMAKAVFNRNLTLVSKSDGYILPDANITEVKYVGGTYHVFSTTLEQGEFHQNEKINYYSSIDGSSWSQPKILLYPGTGEAFDNWGIMAPTVVVEDQSIVLFYTGWKKEDHQCFPEPFPPSVRFGRPSDNDTKCIYGSIGRAVSPRPSSF